MMTVECRQKRAARRKKKGHGGFQLPVRASPSPVRCDATTTEDWCAAPAKQPLCAFLFSHFIPLNLSEEGKRYVLPYE